MNVRTPTFKASTTAPDCAYPWSPDCGDGTSRNPVLHADYSDPDVIRHGDDFWMTSSSFNCTPGLPILHSRDLVNWTLANHALTNVPGERFNEVQPGCGVWAPSIRFHAGKFWIFFPMPDEGIFVTTAGDPGGQWSEPHLVQAGKGLIDPCPLWDDDGQAYLVHAYAGSRAGIKHQLRVCPMAPDGSRLLGEGQIVFHEPKKHPTIEGPKFLKRDGWYYLLAPAGGVATGWQTVLRSRNIFGPYEDRIVLHQGSTPINGPHQGALVDTPGGGWWFLHFQDTGVYGRIVHLQPVEWREGWPLMGAIGAAGTAGEPVLQHRKPMPEVSRVAAPATSDEFTTSRLGLQWQWHANHRAEWFTLAARDGWLRLFAQPATPEFSLIPNLLLQKFPARTFAVETSIDLEQGCAGDEAGLVITGRDHASIAIQRNSRSFSIIHRQNGQVTILAEQSKPQVKFRVEVRDGKGRLFATLREDGQWQHTRQAFQATPGVWVGAKVGLYSIHNQAGPRGFADIDYFRFSTLP